MTDNLKERFLRAKRALFDKLYDNLNSEQRRAVFTVNGPLLVLAGAGSGKTTVLVNRISFIIKYGDAYFSEDVPVTATEDEVNRLEEALGYTKEEIAEILSQYISNSCPPWAVLAITFTNKAAKEIKCRLENTIGDYASEVCSGTFHSFCMRLLRRFTDRAGYKPGFTVYDTDDSKKLILNCIKELNIDEKTFPAKSVQNEISRLKDRLCTPEKFAAESGNDFKFSRLASVYTLYQQKLKESNVLDFDDIIMQTVLMLKNNSDILEWCQNRYKYILVDEYQDTNPAQFELVRMITGDRQNIMVVGDDDQSIYKFRGATIENILSFDKTFPDSKIVKLEENYRSTENILGAANAVISRNSMRHQKELYSSRGEGDKIEIRKLDTQTEEAKYIINKIMELVIREKRHYNDFAVLYRTNVQSNSLEQVFARSGVAYRILGGTRFYDRKEIRDVIAYLCVINNRNDDLRLRRIINEPKRKIGDSTIDTIEKIASTSRVSMFDVMDECSKYPAIYRASSKLIEFTALIRKLSEISRTEPLHTLIEKTLDLSGYRQMLIDGGEAEKERLDNVNELITNAIEFENTHEEPTLAAFLEEIALINDVDSYDEDADAVVLMTIHSAKGLEFPVVFVPGAEEGIFPSSQSAMSDSELEEERRLAYVAITRAKDRLFFTHVRERMLYGHTQYNRISRFLAEIPEEFIENGAKTDAHKPINPSKKRTVISKEFFTKATLASDIGRNPPASERFSVGDEVSHLTFGKGVILSARDMGSDTLYEIAFESCGTKKLMATYAKLKKV
ncbi:MAG: 3'-5' exonuclease [Firmicutes bacterium]|nr:3'-5' exonuclease [Bacillota bacterium]